MLYFLPHTLVGVISERVATCKWGILPSPTPTPGAVKSPQTARREALGSWGRTPQVIELGGCHEDASIENLLFQSEPDHYIIL